MGMLERCSLMKTEQLNCAFHISAVSLGYVPVRPSVAKVLMLHLSSQVHLWWRYVYLLLELP